MSEEVAPDRGEVWFRLASLVMDNRDMWRAQFVKMTGMPFSRYRALRRCEHPTTPTTLATQMDIDAPQVSVILTDLARRGLIERTSDPTDGRRKIITTSAKGRDLLHKVQHDSSASQLLAALDDDELGTLDRLIGKLMGQHDEV